MRRWEQIERYIDALGQDGTFSSREFAEYAEVSPADASKCVQAYLDAQRSSKSETRWVIRRAPGTRTASAKWIIGKRVKDLDGVGVVFHLDVKRKAKRAFEPDLRRLADINPRLARRADAVIDATMDGAIAVLEAAVRA